MRYQTLIATLALTTLVATAQTPHPIMNAKEMKWAPAPGFLPKGAQMTVLEGNPMGSGVFTIRLKMPANYKIWPHWHSTDEMVTVISGDFYLGMGDKINPSASKRLQVGGFAALPAKMHHYAYSKGPAVVQVHAMAPFDIHYIDPKTDPTKGH